MLARLLFHLEYHRGYGPPTVKVRRMPKGGERVVNGGETGHLKRCPTCSGDGMLFVPDHEPKSVGPTDG